jgi:nucleolar protein 56
METLRKQLIEDTKKKIMESFDNESLIIQCSRYLAELDTSIYSMKLRLKGWYGFYDHDVVDVLDVSGEKSSLGADLTEEDLIILNENIETLRLLLILKEDNINYLTKLMEVKVPRLLDVAGVEIGAKLISLAGGVKELASMASSKIQLLGAEKALFRHLKSGNKAPKYGVIYFHKSVQDSEDKGKAARKLASEISKVVKVDYFRK